MRDAPPRGVSDYSTRPRGPADGPRWDAFVRRCPKGTLVHTQRFLGYHGDRFEDRSLFVERGSKAVAVFGAVTHPHRPDEVVSHLGSTFGGPLLPKVAAGESTYDALRAIGAHYRREGARRLVLKLAPAHLSEQPDEPELSALFRLGARIDRVDLWSVIALDRARKRKDIASARRGRQLGVQVAIEDEVDTYVEVHALLEETLRRHDARPVHSPNELIDLRERVGDDQELWVARLADGSIGAAAWLLRHRPGVWHTQYLAASPSARDARALDVLLDDLVTRLSDSGARILSFGASTEDGGRRLNGPLHAFKSKLGGGAVVQHHASWDLQATAPPEIDR